MDIFICKEAELLIIFLSFKNRIDKIYRKQFSFDLSPTQNWHPGDPKEWKEMHMTSTSSVLHHEG